MTSPLRIATVLNRFRFLDAWYETWHLVILLANKQGVLEIEEIVQSIPSSSEARGVLGSFHREGVGVAFAPFPGWTIKQMLRHTLGGGE